MYKEFTASEWKSYLGFSPDYLVSGMLVYGAWDKPKHLGFLENSLLGLQLRVETNQLPDFLERMVEVVIKDKRYWFAISYGGALLSEYIHLACMFGSKKNILLGTCGGLADALATGDFILPTFSYANESTTRAYARDISDHRHYTDEALTQVLSSRVGDTFKVHSGPTVTNQAMMGETLQDIKSWSAEGYLGVEMEAATVFAVSRHFGVPSAGLLVVGDNLIKGETVVGEGYENTRELRNTARSEQYRVALHELLA